MKKLSILLCITLSSLGIMAQTPNQYQPFSYDFYQKLNKKVYSTGNRFHSSIKPYLADDSILAASIDSFYRIGADTIKRSWAHRKIFTEHLFSMKNKDYTAYIDYLPDLQFGYDSESASNTWLNTRGYQIGGTIGKKFSFYTSGYENQSRLPLYIENFVNQNGIIPGQVNDKYGPSKVNKDWAYSTAVLSFTPVKYLNITLGHDKNFIGDGYRSMLLSDLAASYPFLKLTATLGNVKYMAMWAQFEDLRAPQFSYDNGYRKKWGVFHYADWNVNNRLSLGFFDAIIWQDADSTGKRGFDPSYANPFIFLRPLEGQNGSPDNALIGFNAKYEILKNATLYGQLVIDEFTSKQVFAGTGYWANKFAYQLGCRGFDLFHIKRLNYLAEFNTARPYTYSERTSLINYGEYNQPLAHPYGANFRELVGILNYSISRFDFSGKINWAQYGLDGPHDNYGKDIFKSYDTRNADFNNKIAQGIKTNLTFIDTKFSYLLNPKTNLRIELSAQMRSEKNSIQTNQTNLISIGLRSSFRNLYYDF